jgi:hypothetical protein
MKVFQIRYSIILILFFSLISSGILVPNSSAQNAQIPGWIKNVADWWASGDISENEFLTGIEYLINNNIISLDSISCNEKIERQTTSSSEMVPGWIKNNASWWSDNLIDDVDFINGLQYLIEHKIIKIDNKKILGKVPLEDIIFSSSWETDNADLVFIQSSFFEAYGVYGHCIIQDDKQVWESIVLGLNPNKLDMYNEVAVWNDPQKTVVVYPYFTFVAYNEPGFYTYYRGECDSCTTTKFVAPSLFHNEYQASGIGHQALTLLGYDTVTDVDIDRDPSILQQFDKVIMLHNEYVTRTMFDAITSHPNVIYLYPNALYAEIEVDYAEPVLGEITATITLIRGHNYPEHEITNGFDWKFDNTHPYEYDNLCADMDFYQIENGWMTNCYPENVFLQNTEQLFNLLKIIKDL